MDNFWSLIVVWLGGVDDYLTLHERAIADGIIFCIHAFLWVFAIFYFSFAIVKFLRDMHEDKP